MMNTMIVAVWIYLLCAGLAASSSGSFTQTVAPTLQPSASISYSSSVPIGVSSVSASSSLAEGTTTRSQTIEPPSGDKAALKARPFSMPSEFILFLVAVGIASTAGFLLWVDRRRKRRAQSPRRHRRGLRKLMRGVYDDLEGQFDSGGSDDDGDVEGGSERDLGSKVRHHEREEMATYATRRQLESYAAVMEWLDGVPDKPQER